MTKTLLCGVSAAAMLVFSQGAFAQAEFSPDEVSGSITFYTHWTNFISNGDMEKWENEFKEMYPNVDDIDVQGIGTYADTMATRMATGDYGDVLEIADALSVEELGDFLMPLNDLNLEDDFYFPERWQYEGNIYAYTYGVNVQGIVYNKNTFEQAGIDAVPTTLTEFYEDAEKLKEAGIIPFVTNMGSGWTLATFDALAMAISGDPDFFTNMVNDPAPFAADRPYGQALGILHTLIERGLTEEDLTSDNWQESKGWMASGQASMWYLGNWSINQIIDEGAVLVGADDFSLDDLGFFPLPYDDSGEVNAPSNPDYAMAVAANTQNPTLAKAWLQFLLTKTPISQQAGFIPGYKGMEPTLPQLTEFNSFEPNLISFNTPSTTFTDAKNLIGFENGSGTRDLMNERDYDAAIDKLNERWERAVQRVSR